MTTKRTYSPEEAVERLKQLPPSARQFIYSKDMTAVLTQIGEKNGLHLDQLGYLENEIVAFMLGFTEPIDFTSCIAQSLNIPKDKATGIVKDVNELLLIKLHQTMEGTVPTPSPHIISENNTSDHTMELSPATSNIVPALPSSVDTALSTPTVQVLQQNTNPFQKEPTAPSQPPSSSVPLTPYKTDPYREPIE